MPGRAATLLALSLLLAGAAAGPAAAQSLEVSEEVLPNGLRVLVAERHRVPRVFCAIFVGTGAAAEKSGKTGLAHLLEHMLFKGTRAIGVLDLGKDAGFIAKADTVMLEAYRLEQRARDARRRGLEPEKADVQAIERLRAEHKAIAAEQKKILRSEELWTMYLTNGGTALNASTGQDSTQYFVELPANKIELYFWLESDRLLNAVFREYYFEVDVVKEERRMRTESTPTGMVREEFGASFWGGHPYHRPVVGWMADLDVVTRQDAEDYFRLHYVPENMTAVFVGDAKPTDVFALARRYLGRLPRGTRAREAVVVPGPNPTGEKRMLAKAAAPDSVEIRWPAVATAHPDGYALDLLAEIFSGRSGRLYRRLVEEKKLALEADGSSSQSVYGGTFSVTGRPQKGVAHADLEAALLAEVAAAAEAPPEPAEWERVQNAMESRIVQGLESNQGVAFLLGRAAVAGDWREATRALERFRAVWPEDLPRVAKAYLTPSRKAVLHLVRDAAAGRGIGPGLADVGPGTPGAAPDVAKLEAAVARLEASWREVHPAARAGILERLRTAVGRLADERAKEAIEKRLQALEAKG
ncbi:MAG: insulinase family protein [Planctomycetales bacterium]|nr:insulinase family protein [Planctomycetales bacterium]